MSIAKWCVIARRQTTVTRSVGR